MLNTLQKKEILKEKEKRKDFFGPKAKKCGNPSKKERKKRFSNIFFSPLAMVILSALGERFSVKKHIKNHPPFFLHTFQLFFKTNKKRLLRTKKKLGPPQIFFYPPPQKKNCVGRGHDTYIHSRIRTDIATTRPNWPSGLICWKVLDFQQVYERHY